MYCSNYFFAKLSAIVVNKIMGYNTDILQCTECNLDYYLSFNNNI